MHLEINVVTRYDFYKTEFKNKTLQFLNKANELPNVLVSKIDYLWALFADWRLLKLQKYITCTTLDNIFEFQKPRIANVITLVVLQAVRAGLEVHHQC